MLPIVDAYLTSDRRFQGIDAWASSSADDHTKHTTENQIMFICPVCGWPEVEEDPEKNLYNICSCCGAEYGYDNDMQGGYAGYRLNWISKGCPWFDVGFGPPEGWDPMKQLATIGVVI